MRKRYFAILFIGLIWGYVSVNGQEGGYDPKNPGPVYTIGDLNARSGNPCGELIRSKQAYSKSQLFYSRDVLHLQVGHKIEGIQLNGGKMHFSEKTCCRLKK